MQPLPVSGRGLTLAQLVQVARHDRRVILAPEARDAVAASAAWVARAAAGELVEADGSPKLIYGVNTGYGSLARVRIPMDRTAELSANLIRSHAAGVGEPLPRDAVRAMMLLRANALARGASGCRPELIENLLRMLDHGVTPVIPTHGSCGSSGDLAPLAHLGLVLLQAEALPEDPTGKAWFFGELLDGDVAMAAAGIERLVPGPKEGLAVTNGAQLCAAQAALATWDAMALIDAAEIAAALSWEALRGVTRALHPDVHVHRPYPGAIDCAANLRALLAGSNLVDSLPGKVQDAYSLRCTPQVLGAVRDATRYVADQVIIEINATTDNPLILVDQPDENKAFSAGMFHGEPVGMVADHLKLAVAELAAISERRTYRLTTGSLSAQLPPALRSSDRPDLGMMVPQTAAASLVSENRALAWPSTADSIPTCEDQEDHVAMATTATRLAWRVVENSRRVVAIELLVASRGVAWRQRQDDGARLGAGTAAALAWIEDALAGLGDDAAPSDAIERLAEGIADGSLNAAVAAAIGAPRPVLR